MSTIAADHIPTRIKLFHGLGSIAYGVKENGFSTFLLLFYNQVVGIPSAQVSLALMIALVLDAFADPIIGHLSDRTYTRWGRRLPWLYLAPIPLGLAWLLMWTPPVGESNATILFYLVVVAMLVRTLVSACEVPSVSLIPELTRDYDERTAIMRYRYLFAWGGGLTMLFLAFSVFLVPTPEYPVGQLNAEGYWAYGVTCAVVMASAVLISAAGQHKRVAHLPEKRPEKTTIAMSLAEIRESLSHRAFLILIGAGALAFTSQGLTYSISNYLYIYVWQFSKTAFNLYPIVLFASAFCAFLWVPSLNRRFGKRETAMVCGIIGLVFWTTPFALRLAGFWPEIGSTASTAGAFVGAFGSTIFATMVMITASSMIADVVEASEVQTGRRTEGLFYAGNMFMQKCATGLGIGIAGLIISWAGLSDKALPGQVSDDVIDRLTIAYCLVIATIAFVATWIFSRFPINRADHEARVRHLAAQKAS
jgi:glycoside/pentoside/hexuronide:cation symporter, GPH family